MLYNTIQKYERHILIILNMCQILTTTRRKICYVRRLKKSFVFKNTKLKRFDENEP